KDAAVVAGDDVPRGGARPSDDVVGRAVDKHAVQRVADCYGTCGVRADDVTLDNIGGRSAARQMHACGAVVRDRIAGPARDATDGVCRSVADEYAITTVTERVSVDAEADVVP